MSYKQRVLLYSETEATDIIDILSNDFDVFVTQDFNELNAYEQKYSPSVLILHINDADIVPLLKYITLNLNFLDVPTLLLSPLLEAKDEHSVLEMGVLEIIPHPDKLHLLATKVRNISHTFSQQSLYQHRLNALYVHTPVMMHSIDHEGKIVNVSDCWLRKMEYSRNEVLGRKSTEFLSESSMKKAVEVILPKFMQEGSVENVPYEFVTKSGKILNLLLSASAIRNDVGGIAHSFAVLFDQSEKITIENELFRKTSELEMIFNSVPSMMWLKDEQNIILRANKHAADTVSMSTDEIIGKNTYDLYPEMAAKYHADDLEVLRSGVPKLNIVEQYTPAGAPTGWVKTDKIPFFDPISHEQLVLVIATDVTETKSIEMAYLKSQERFQLAIQGSSVGIWDWFDVNKDKQYWSPRFYEMLGLKDNEISASLTNLRKLIHPHDRERTFAAINSHFDMEAPFEIEYRLEHSTLGFRWFLSKGQANFDDAGNPCRMVGTILDIHDRKINEQELAKKQEELVRSNQELEKFAFITSHDLQEPLRMISNYSELLQKKYAHSFDEKGLRYLSHLTNGGVKMQKMISGLLAYSRIQEQVALNLEDCDLRSVVKDILDSLVTEIENSRAKIEINGDANLKADSVQLVSILQNIISNAIKYRSDRPLEIDIDIGTNDLGWIQVMVSDNGIGFDQHYADKAFQLFHRLHGKDQYEGTGIGLAIVKKAVERHCGEVLLQSEKGKGTSVTVAFPVS
ncbi:MAG: PAS domain S-box protein [Alteromonadaceae bacterium]|nr:PAS domain S-box protein [Alteromonadaceae bacterium]